MIWLGAEHTFAMQPSASTEEVWRMVERSAMENNVERAMDKIRSQKNEAKRLNKSAILINCKTNKFKKNLMDVNAMQLESFRPGH